MPFFLDVWTRAGVVSRARDKDGREEGKSPTTFQKGRKLNRKWSQWGTRGSLTAIDGMHFVCYYLRRTRRMIDSLIFVIPVVDGRETESVRVVDAIQMRQRGMV